MILSSEDFDAVLFDLDGVLTNTARIHAIAWKRVFDSFLRARAARTGTSFVAFDADTDYRLHVDGKARHDGIIAFLRARGIDLPDDSRDVRAIGRLKTDTFSSS